MKNRISRARLLVAAGAAVYLASSVGFAADTNQAPAPAPASKPAAESRTQAAVTAAATASPGVTESGPVKLPYGVDEVLKLSQAKISDDVTLTYIQNSGTSYNLGAQEIVYLKNQGVSDNVINAMQGQRKKAMESAVQITASSPAPVYSAPAPIYAQPALYVPPVESIAVSEPDYVPASTMYVIPYPGPTYPRYTYASSYPGYGNYGNYVVYGGGPGGFGPVHGFGGRPAPFRFGGGGGSRGHFSRHR